MRKKDEKDRILNDEWRRGRCKWKENRKRGAEMMRQRKRERGGREGKKQR